MVEYLEFSHFNMKNHILSLVLLFLVSMAMAQTSDVRHGLLLDARHFLLDATLPDSTVRQSPYLFNDFKDAVAHLASSLSEKC